MSPDRRDYRQVRGFEYSPSERAGSHHFNLFISNVPGPTVELYPCGARLDGVYPLLVIVDSQGLNITVLGSIGKLN